MSINKSSITLLIFFAAGAGYALEPNEILVIANSDIAESVRLAQYYCTNRSVPADNILALPLGTSISNTITRNNYERKLAGPIRKKLYSAKFTGKIRCLLTTYGVPFKVGRRRQLKGRENKLKQLKQLAEQEKNEIKRLGQSNSADSAKQKENSERKLAQLQILIDFFEEFIIRGLPERLLQDT